MIGTLVANYRVTRKLGEGGMGAVYLAEHQFIGRKAAIKVLLPEISGDPGTVERFFNEARSSSLIQHPGIVDIFDFGKLEDGRAYIAMEFLDGTSLASHLDGESCLALASLVAIGRQIASALAAAHAKNIVHRDLKPDNIFLVPDAEVQGGLRVKILDFGIAKLADSNFKTITGAVMGTPAYMAPEQCENSGEIDHRADIYALGCVLFEMACGRVPFLRRGFGPMMAAHLYDPAPSLRSIERSVDPRLERTVLRALAKKPEARHQTMVELREELGQILDASRTDESPRIPTERASPPPLGPVVRELARDHSFTTTLGYTASESTAPAPSVRSKSRTGWLAVAAVAIGAIGGAALLVGRHPAASVLAARPPGSAPSPSPAVLPTAALLLAGAPHAPDATLRAGALPRWLALDPRPWRGRSARSAFALNRSPPAPRSRADGCGLASPPATSSSTPGPEWPSSSCAATAITISKSNSARRTTVWPTKSCNAAT